MLKLFAHCWLILSLLVAPLQFAAADMAVIDHAEMKCEMMDMQAGHDMPAGGMEHSMAQDSCECPDQCKVSCTGAHLSLGMNSVLQFVPVSPLYQASVLTTSIHGIPHRTELRPPIA